MLRGYMNQAMKRTAAFIKAMQESLDDLIVTSLVTQKDAVCHEISSLEQASLVGRSEIRYVAQCP